MDECGGMIVDVVVIEIVDMVVNEIVDCVVEYVVGGDEIVDDVVVEKVYGAATRD